jgi:hypothetical protein
LNLGPALSLPGENNDYHAPYIARVVRSFAHVTGKNLVREAGLDTDALGKSAWSGQFALLTHRGDRLATLNYGNLFALRLWEMDWSQLTVTPSRETAPREASAARDLLMEKVAKDNFVTGYSGERASRTGRRFLIEDVTIWRLLDEKNQPFGMAAFFRRFRYLEGPSPLL